MSLFFVSIFCNFGVAAGLGSDELDCLPGSLLASDRTVLFNWLGCIEETFRFEVADCLFDAGGACFDEVSTWRSPPLFLGFAVEEDGTGVAVGPLDFECE